METVKKEVAIFLKRICYLLACCNSQIIVGSSQLDEKPPEQEPEQ